MLTKRRLISFVLISLPAMLFGGCALTLFQGEYYWGSYVLASVVYIAAGVIIELVLPAFGRPWIRILLVGGLAWCCAALFLGITSLTPLCIGQNNGDGINDLAMCVGQTVLAVMVYSPGILVLLGLSAFVGNKVLR